ncbi:MAG: FecR domain-containing protein [Massilia sp.]
MLRRLLVTTVLAGLAPFAAAADAGKVIFVAGTAKVADQPAVEGARVQEGQMLSTGADGFIYVKTVDNGLFILRPQTKARIVTYHVDTANPANTHVKLELISGVARSKSGDAVKLARQNFRFNTPVAAIGVRGTDFTVFTDDTTSRVAVISGRVIVSGFAGACGPEGSGPCEGNASRELTAAQRGKLLQVSRGQAAPQLLSSSPLSPDQVSPPRADEPLAKAGGGVSGGVAVIEPNLEAKKSADLGSVIEKTPPPVITPPEIQPPVVLPPERGIVWGRWQQIGLSRPLIDLQDEMTRSELVAVNGNFALLRTAGRDYVAPNNGSVGFQLKDSEALIYTDYGTTPGSRVTTLAAVTNGRLNVDFGSKTFATNLDLISDGKATPLQARGAVGVDGRLYGDPANARPGYINVQGLLSSDKGGSAAYIFDGRLDALRTVNGATYWRK